MPAIEDRPAPSLPHASGSGGVASPNVPRATIPLSGHLPPLSPRGQNLSSPFHNNRAGGYVNRRHVGTAPLSPPAAGMGPRSRSRSLGNSPLLLGGLSPHLPPKTILPGLPDFRSLPPEPPVISASQRAMEAAVQKERQRAKDMEKEEADLNADELRAVLKRERHRMARLAADLASMRSTAVQSVLEAEVNEEGRINCLMRRLEGLQQEKGRIIVELEREEEMLTNNLQKKLNEVRREKDMLAKQQMSRSELEARLKALQTGAGGDIDMAESADEKEEMEEEG